jgi:hypothetical protein
MRGVWAERYRQRISEPATLSSPASAPAPAAAADVPASRQSRKRVREASRDVKRLCVGSNVSVAGVGITQLPDELLDVIFALLIAF